MTSKTRSRPAAETPAKGNDKVQEALDWASNLTADEAIVALQELATTARLTHQQRALLLTCCNRLGGIQLFVQGKGLSPDVVYRQLTLPTAEHFASVFRSK